MLSLSVLAGAGSVLWAILLAAVLHEAGHLAVLYLTGAPVKYFRFTAFGAEIRADTRRLTYGQEILCSLAGPAVNLIFAVILSRLSGSYVLSGANLLLGLFNLLPVSTLDGGRSIHLFISWLTDPFTADRISLRAGLFCSILLFSAAVVLSLRYRAGIFLPLAAFGTLLGQLPLVKPPKKG